MATTQRLRYLLGPGEGISDYLTTEELDVLKYVLQDHLTKVEREKITTILQLFEQLMKKRKVHETDLSLLWQAFELMGRRDLQNKIEQSFQGSVPLPESKNQISEYRQTLYKVTTHLGRDSVEKLRFHWGDHKSTNVFDLFNTAEQKDVFSDTNLHKLYRSLLSINDNRAAALVGGMMEHVRNGGDISHHEPSQVHRVSLERGTGPQLAFRRLPSGGNDRSASAPAFVPISHADSKGSGGRSGLADLQNINVYSHVNPPLEGSCSSEQPNLDLALLRRVSQPQNTRPLSEPCEQYMLTQASTTESYNRRRPVSGGWQGGALHYPQDYSQGTQYQDPRMQFGSMASHDAAISMGTSSGGSFQQSLTNMSIMGGQTGNFQLHSGMPGGQPQHSVSSYSYLPTSSVNGMSNYDSSDHGQFSQYNIQTHQFGPYPSDLIFPGSYPGGDGCGKEVNDLEVPRAVTGGHRNVTFNQSELPRSPVQYFQDQRLGHSQQAPRVMQNQHAPLQIQQQTEANNEQCFSVRMHPYQESGSASVCTAEQQRGARLHEQREGTERGGMSDTKDPQQGEASNSSEPTVTSGDCQEVKSRMTYEQAQNPMNVGVRELRSQEMEACYTRHDQIGRGTFASVFKGKFENLEVAVKEFYCKGEGENQHFIQERSSIYLKHPFLLPVLAICDEPGNRFKMLMYPLMQKTLEEVLFPLKPEPTILSHHDRLRVATQTCLALEFLHTKVPGVRNRICHGDVKPSNILMDSHGNARLSDTGLAVEISSGKTHATVGSHEGTEGYRDPKMKRKRGPSGNDFLFERQPINDIFSVGVVMLQLLTGQRSKQPSVEGDTHTEMCLWQTLSRDSPEKLCQHADTQVWTLQTHQPQLSLKFASIVIECLKEKDRINVHQLCDRLKDLLQENQVKYMTLPESGPHCCLTCLKNPPAEFLPVKSSMCSATCSWFCQPCLSSAFRNPLICPHHGCHAMPSIGHENTYAVLVAGPDHMCPELFVKDAKALYKVLVDGRVVGLAKNHVRLLTPTGSGSNKTSRENVSQSLTEMCTEMKNVEGVTFIFYFSGHCNKQGSLKLTDGYKSPGELREELAKLPVTQMLIILDCCYAASTHLSDLPYHEENVHYLRNVTNAEINKDMPVPVLCSLQRSQNTADEKCYIQWSSASEHQTAMAIAGKMSIFTKHLVAGLQSGVKCHLEDSNSDSCTFCKHFRKIAEACGYIDFSDLKEYVFNHVKREGQLITDSIQQPEVHGTFRMNMKMAYYNPEPLFHEVVFQPEEGQPEVVKLESWPDSLRALRKKIWKKLKAHFLDRLPKCMKPDHLKLHCHHDEGEIIDDQDLQKRVKKGIRLKCCIRQTSDDFDGNRPVLLPHKNGDRMRSIISDINKPPSLISSIMNLQGTVQQANGGGPGERRDAADEIDSHVRGLELTPHEVQDQEVAQEEHLTDGDSDDQEKDIRKHICNILSKKKRVKVLVHDRHTEFRAESDMSDGSDED